MKPNFALDFTEDRIALLHRTSRGWLEVGTASFDEADLAQAITYLRSSALGLEPRGMTTKLVIPNAQVLYLTLAAPGPDDASRLTQIRAGLEGRTPYAVDELVFDWTGTGPEVQVAVVARETLDEAEAFAREHRLNPLSFVAVPPPGSFGAEPWFGPSAMAPGLLSPGEKVERDSTPITIVGRSTAPAEPAPAAVKPDPEPAQTEAAPEPAPEPGPALSEPVVAVPEDPLPETAPPAEDPPAPVVQVTANSIPDDSAAVDAPSEPLSTPPATKSSAAGPETIAPAAPMPAARAMEPAPAKAEPPAPPALAEAEEAPFALDVPQEGDDVPPLPPGLRPRAPETVAPPPRKGQQQPPRKAPKAPDPRSAPATRPNGPALVASRPAGSAAVEAVSPLEKVTNSARQGRDAGRQAASMVTAPSIPVPRERRAAAVADPVAAEAPAQERQKSEAESMTVFGARQASQRGKPRYLGLILTLILLLFLAAVGVWSSIFLAGWGNSEDAPAVAETAAETPAPEDEMLADLQDPAELEEAGEIEPVAPLALDTTDTAAATEEPLAGAEGAVPEAATEAEALAETQAPAEAAATAEPVAEPATVPLPDTAASEARTPGSDLQDEIFLATSNPAPDTTDAIALAPPLAATDTPPGAQPVPPPFGTEYSFDAEGRIQPTPEGIITPEGVRLVAGRPSLVPPARPAALAEPAPAPASADAPANASTAGVVTAPAETPAVEVFADPALAGARPRARPEGLVPPETTTTEDDAALSSDELVRFSSLRPRVRPPEILAAGEAALTAQQEADAAEQAAAASVFAGASELAVAVSRVPAPRPNNFSKSVEAAVAEAVREPEPIVEPVVAQPAVAAKPKAEEKPAVVAEAHEADEIDEPEVASAAPDIPTRASVAKQATFANAINLSKTNLIGVYGTSSKRYALVRQPSGRFVKVSVGDRLDGGKVAAITDRDLSYVKNGRTVTLTLPKG